ncbi:MAG: M23 family metallopeptidase [Leptolyngbyaceae bacterium]|nr:M23 family metallopeptidase [Leptolyngbyaceae bacterium]
MRQRAKQALIAYRAALIASGFIGLSAVNSILVPVAIATDALSDEQDKNTPKSSEDLALPVGAQAFNLALADPDAKVSEPETFGPETALPVAPVDLSTLSPEFSVTGQAAGSNGSTYIDPTDYDIGATELPSVILSERSTGCRTVLERGEVVSNSICGPTATGSYEGSYGSYPEVNAIRVGPISVGADGIRLVRSFNISDYYNRTQRPQAFAGNENSQMMFPLSIPALISSPFGWRSHPIFGNTRFHTGTDIAAPMGTPVVATFSGRITVADFLGGYGLTVVIRHEDNSTETLYGHLSEIFVRPGETIQQGEVIGRVGSTGNSTGPHLHFELRQPTADGWVAVNSGELLQNALALVQNGLRLAGEIPEAGEDLIALNIPDFLLSGKNAIKRSDVREAEEGLKKADDSQINQTDRL